MYFGLGHNFGVQHQRPPALPLQSLKATVVLCVKASLPQAYVSSSFSHRNLFSVFSGPSWMKEFVFRQDSLFRKGVVSIHWRSQELFSGCTSWR